MITAIIIGVFVLLLVLLVAASYIKAPPDMAYLISGLRKKPRIIIGKATLRIPFLERIDAIPLKLIQVDIKTMNSVRTSEFINIFVDGVANIKISNKPELLAKAAENFLNRSPVKKLNLSLYVVLNDIR